MFCKNHTVLLTDTLDNNLCTKTVIGQHKPCNQQPFITNSTTALDDKWLAEYKVCKLINFKDTVLISPLPSGGNMFISSSHLQPLIRFLLSFHIVHLIISRVITSVHKLSLGVFQQNKLSAFKCRCHSLSLNWKNSLISPSTYRNAIMLQYETKRTKAEDVFVSIPRLGFKAMEQTGNTEKDLKMSQPCQATMCGVKFSRQNHWVEVKKNKKTLKCKCWQ